MANVIIALERAALSVSRVPNFHPEDVDRKEIMYIYTDPRTSVLPTELNYLILRFANLCKLTSKSIYFYIYVPRNTKRKQMCINLKKKHARK